MEKQSKHQTGLKHTLRLLAQKQPQPTEQLSICIIHLHVTVCVSDNTKHLWHCLLGTAFWTRFTFVCSLASSKQAAYRVANL